MANNFWMYFGSYARSSLDAILKWIGIFLGNLFSVPPEGVSTLHVLIPLVGLGAAFIVVKFGIHIVKSFFFGF